MGNIKSYKIFESAPRIPRLTEKGLDYWKSKGKKGKDVMIYTHDDMDGIFSAIAVKSRMLDLGYNIIGYGLLDYMVAWKNTTVDSSNINVAVDFAEMPNDSKKEKAIDIYIDHHGEYNEEEKEHFKENPVIKTHTGSAYEGICNVIGKPIDEITLYSIDMIDSAKYDDYMVDWRDILNFSWERFLEIARKPGKVTIKPFKNSKSVTLGWPIIAKLTFAGAFNQFLKRSDYKTVIEVIDNVKDPSIYAIFLAMKKVYPGNNIWTTGYSVGDEKDFVDDSQWRLKTMQQRTRGDGRKPIYHSQKDFLNDGAGTAKGYQIIGNLMFVPSGTWANALRARSILQTDYDNGVIPKEHQVNFILLQYGNTLQICSVQKMDKITNLPVLKNGKKIENLGSYMGGILKNFQKFFGYYETKTTIGQDELTVAGGHIGIGTISNVVGRVDEEKITQRNQLNPQTKKLVQQFQGYKYLDLFKNKIMADLSGLDSKWPVSLKWSNDGDNDMRPVMIREILNKHPEYIAKWMAIADDIEMEYDTRLKAEKKAKSEVRDYLKLKDDEELEKIHTVAMSDSKVMMKKDIRQVDKEGNIPNRKEQNVMSFESFVTESSDDYNLPKKVEDFFLKFPDDAKGWGQATDELRDLSRSMKEFHIEYDQDLLLDDENAYKSLDFSNLKSPSEWNTESKKYMRELWTKMSNSTRKEWLDNQSFF